MTIERVLLCVDGSPAALAAARLAIGLAAGWRAAVRAVYVAQDAGIGAAIDAIGMGRLPPAEQRLAKAATGVLDHIVELGRAGGAKVETKLVWGEPFEELLREARTYRPDIVAIGRAGRRGPGPALGAVTEHLLEFAEWPVIVVPAAGDPEEPPAR